MICTLVDFALNNRFVVLALAVLAVGWGALSFHNLPVEAYPDIADNYATIITQWPGRAAEEVEQQVTIPIEIQMNGIPHLTHLRSESIFGLSFVLLIRLVAHKFPDMVVGGGTVLDSETAHRCIDAGARFITSTGLIPEVVATTLKANVVAIPGALTPTEVIASWKFGGDYVKIFPAASLGGDLYIRSLKLPLPQIPLIAAGGVSQQTAEGFIRAGASALGLGMELFPKDAIAKRQDHRIQELARRFLAFVQKGRSPE